VDSDVSTSYELLASIYKDAGNTAALDTLIEHAEKLTSPSGKIIVRKLSK
jgi:hypothetical protein